MRRLAYQVVIAALLTGCAASSTPPDPTAEPTPSPTAVATVSPTAEPTLAPTPVPSGPPTLGLNLIQGDFEDIGIIFEKADLNDGRPRWLGRGAGGLVTVEVIAPVEYPGGELIQMLTFSFPIGSGSDPDVAEAFQTFATGLSILVPDSQVNSWLSDRIGEYDSGDFDRSETFTYTSELTGVTLIEARIQIYGSMGGLSVIAVEAIE